MAVRKSPGVTVGVEDLEEGDLVDLEGVDVSKDNQQIWPFEYARVESVSYEGHLSGGWCDGIIAVNPSRAIIYLANGAEPAEVSRFARLTIGG